jgi:hypothetical protein
VWFIFGWGHDFMIAVRRSASVPGRISVLIMSMITTCMNIISIVDML